MGNWFAKEINIELVQHKRQVTAGKSEKCCTLKISFDEADTWDESQNSLPAVKIVNQPIDCDEKEDKITDLKWKKNLDGMPEMAIYVWGKKAGPRTMKLQFSRKVAIRNSTRSVYFQKDINSYSLSLEVLPSVPRNLKLCKQRHHATNRFNAFRREKLSVEVEVQDEFGNLVHEGHGIEIQPFAISHTNPPNAEIVVHTSQKIKLGTYKVFVTCFQAGDVDLYLHLAGIENYLCVPLTVKIPPASCRHSGMTPKTLDRINNCKFEAGKEVVFEIQVYDIFGKALSHADNDSSVKFHGQLKPKTSKNKQSGSEDRLTDQACKVNDVGSESNLYQIKFVPLVAGKRELDFSIGGESVTGFPVCFKVVPSQTNSLCAEIASPKVLASKKDILKVTAFDRFKNVVNLNNQLHKLEISSPNSNEAKITVLPITIEDDKRFCRGVIFHTAGEHTVTVNLHTSSEDTRVVTQILTVTVTLPPISLAHSTVLSTSPLTTKAGEPIVISVKLRDVFGNPVSYDDLRTLKQEIPLRADFRAISSSGNASEESLDFDRPQEKLGSVKPTQQVGVFELCCVPFVAGERTLNVQLTYAVGEQREISNSPVHVNVLPNQRIHCSNVLHYFDETPLLSRHSWQRRSNEECVIAKTWQRVVVRMLDQYNNVVKAVPRNISLRLAETDNQSPISDFLETKDEVVDDCEVIACKSSLYRILKPGKYTLNVSIGEGNKTDDTGTYCPETDIETEQLLTGQFEVEVKDATLSLTNVWYEDEPVFENRKTFFTIMLKETLGDDCVIAEPSEIKTLVQKALRITIDGQERKMHNLQVDSDTVKFEISDIGDAGEKLLEVVLREKCTTKLLLNVVGIQELPKESLRSPRVPNNVGDGKHFALWCKGFERCVVTGPDCSHLDNINRVYSILVGKRSEGNAKVLDATDVEETNGTVEINLSKLGKDEAAAIVVRKLVLLNLKGDHFRRQAWELDSERRKWKQRANEAHDKKQYDKASFSRRTKETYGELMSNAHAKASESIFDFYNYDRNQSEIDLHELLVADEEKIKEYHRQLQHDPRYKRHDIDRMISEKRDNDNEALRKLQHRLENFDRKAARHNHSPWLEIIVGAGHHSDGQRQRIRPEVEKFLQKKERGYGVINKGSLLITFEKYGGKQPCVADYYCERCHRTWPSALAWVDKSQDCRNHPKQRCFPVKLRPRDPKSRDSHCTDPGEREKRKVEHMRSCQMCKELGEYCGSSSVTTRRA